MKLSKTGLRILSRQYSLVLKKCLLINMGLMFVATGAMADVFSLNDGETTTIDGDVDTQYKFGGWKINFPYSELQDGTYLNINQELSPLVEDLQNIKNVTYSNAGNGSAASTKVEIKNSKLNMENARIFVDPNESNVNDDGTIDAIEIINSTIILNNSSLDASTDDGDKQFNTIFDNATLKLVNSELPIDGDVKFENRSKLSISAPDYFTEEEFIAMLKDETKYDDKTNAERVAEYIKGLSSDAILNYKNSDGTAGSISLNSMQVEQMLELKSLTIDKSDFIIGDSTNENDRARVSSDGQIFIQNGSKVILNNRAIMTFDNSEADEGSKAELLVDKSHITLNDNSQLNVTRAGNATAKIQNNSQIFMNDSSQMNLGAVEMTDSHIHMEDYAVLKMESVTLLKSSIMGSGTNKIIIAGEEETTFEDTSMEISDNNIIQISDKSRFKIQANNDIVKITGNSADDAVISMEGDATEAISEGESVTTVDINGGSQGVVIDGAIVSKNKNNNLNFSGNVQMNGLLDPLTANVADGTTIHSYYADDINFNLNNGGTLKYTSDKYLYDDTKHGSTYVKNSVNFNGGTLDLANNEVSTIKLSNLTLSKESNINLDADLANKKMDTLTADTITANAKLNIAKLNLISDATEETTEINFTKDADLLTKIDYSGAATGLSALSPLYSYDVAYNNQSGDFTFSRKDGYNPAVYSTSVVGKAVGFLQQNIAGAVFDKLGAQISNPMGLSSGDEPYSNHAWMSMIGADDKVEFDSFETVDSEMMSVVGGFNSDKIKFGNSSVGYGVYVGYLTGEGKYTGNAINQEGGYVGLSSSLQNGDFIVASTVNGGFIQNEAKHSFGTDKYDTYWSGLSLKSGYDFHLPNALIIQPNVYAGYSFVSTEDYTSKSGAKFENDDLHLFEIAPGLKISKAFDNGWGGFAQAKYAFLMDNGGDTNVDAVVLPNISAKDYFEYGVGVDKNIQSDWSLEATVNRRDGGREGWNGSLTLKYNF